MKELDLLLENYLDTLTNETHLLAFERLLECNDTDLYAWLTGRGVPAAADLASVVAGIRSIKAAS
jgi:succinate dehydrogenase flavin-adding protein (antitoxin of CptAB toxin-antitoxin module)